MILMRHTSGEHCLVLSLDGYDMADWTVIDEDVDDPNDTDQTYDTTGTRIPRPRTDRELARNELQDDLRWDQLKNATGPQIDAWLAEHVTNLAQAREVLGLVFRAIRKLAADGRFE